MSATLETEAVSRLLEPGSQNPSAVLRCPGRTFPVRTIHRPVTGPRWEEAFADGLAALFDETEGDILAFLPGAGEIRRTGARLGGLLAGRAEVLGLHGMMPLSDQRRIAMRGPSDREPRGEPGRGPTADAGQRRVILSTSIAETSLTVPGNPHCRGRGLGPALPLPSGHRSRSAGDGARQPVIGGPAPGSGRPPGARAVRAFLERDGKDSRARRSRESLGPTFRGSSWNAHCGERGSQASSHGWTSRRQPSGARHGRSSGCSASCAPMAPRTLVAQWPGWAFLPGSACSR